MTLFLHGDSRIQDWTVNGERIFVSYFRRLQTRDRCFRSFRQIDLAKYQSTHENTVRLLGGSEDEAMRCSSNKSLSRNRLQICSYSSTSPRATLWAEREVPFDSRAFSHIAGLVSCKRQDRRFRCSL